MQQTIIIGSGIAGLAAAARLAAKGFEVTVFEKNNAPGGKLGTLSLDGFTFDTGPSLFTQPYLLEELFQYCGRELGNYLTYHKLPVSTHYFYEDGTQLNAYEAHDELANEIETKLGCDATRLTDFLIEAASLYNNVGKLFLEAPLFDRKLWTGAALYKAFKTLKPAYLLQSMDSYHKRKLQHPALIQLFNRFATYNGSDPYKAPAMLSMIAHLEMNEGAYYPKGGMISIIQALYQLCRDLGVQFSFGEKVDKIIHKHGRVSGIAAGGKQYDADFVISNADVYFTYKNLLNDISKARQLKEQERSSSAVIFYWGIKKQFQQLQLHNIFFSEDYKAEFNHLFDLKSIYQDPTIYINITSKEESGHAPEGCENWFVLVNTPASANTDVAEIRRLALQKLSRMLGCDIAQLVQTEGVLTPSGIEEATASYMGALYGTSSNSAVAAFLRHGNRSRYYSRLYFAGGTVHPGGGIPLCLRSGKIASELLIKDARKS